MKFVCHDAWFPLVSLAADRLEDFELNVGQLLRHARQPIRTSLKWRALTDECHFSTLLPMSFWMFVSRPPFPRVWGYILESY